MSAQNTRLGIYLMICTTLIFASQDSISRFLSDKYSVYLIVMMRYWGLAAFATLWLMRRKGGLQRALATPRPFLQIFRGLLFAVEVLLLITAFVKIGLVDAPAIFAAFPLMVIALSGPILGEKVGWRRWASVAIGFIGVLVIVRPGSSLFTPASLIPFIGAILFAFYSLLNRYVARFDPPEVSIFYTGVAGLVLTTAIGVFHWEVMLPEHYALMGVLICTTILSQICLIKAYDLAEASALQPFAYLQLPFSAIYGVILFGDIILPNVAVGALIVVGAGLFSIARTRKVQADNT